MSYFRSIPGGRHAGLSEGELWDLFRKGEKEAFDLIYHNYVHLLYNYGIRISSDTVLVEDGIQDLFVEIWQKRATLGATGSIKYYLFKSLRRKISRKVLRETRFYHKLLNRSGVDFELSPEQTLLDGESFEQQRRNLFSALNSLPRRQKEAVFLKYFEGLPYAEIASIMGIQAGAVYKLVCKAISVLRKKYPRGYFINTLLFL